MRVITPQYSGKQRRKQQNRRLRVIFLLFLLVLIAFGVYFVQASSNYFDGSERTSEKTPEVTKKKEFRVFVDEEFKNLYNNFNYVNTNKITEPPIITGNEKADEKIRIFAEGRGYRLRRQARSNEGDADGFKLQLLAKKSWDDLKAFAASEGIVLTITSAFRSVDDQRDYFLEGLASQGVTAQDIASGEADIAVDRVLQTFAPPGYSRHHTGFTVDLTCGTNGLTYFATTPCYEWLSRDNYIHAKTFGWIPSYPEGASLQGPEPEPWEYAWVTVDALLK